MARDFQGEHSKSTHMKIKTSIRACDLQFERSGMFRHILCQHSGLDISCLLFNDVTDKNINVQSQTQATINTFQTFTISIDLNTIKIGINLFYRRLRMFG